MVIINEALIRRIKEQAEKTTPNQELYTINSRSLSILRNHLYTIAIDIWNSFFVEGQKILCRTWSYDYSFDFIKAVVEFYRAFGFNVVWTLDEHGWVHNVKFSW